MRIVAVSLHSATWVHAFPEAVVLESLVAAGHQVTTLGCGRALTTYCVAMSSFGLAHASSPEAKARICARCELRRGIVARAFPFAATTLDAVLEAGDHAQVAALMADLRQPAAFALQVDGIPLGRYALYEFLLHHKRTDLELPPEQWIEYLAALRNTLVAYLGARRLFARERPERVLIYNTFYSANNAAAAAARSAGIPVYALHAGLALHDRLTRLLVARDNNFNYYTQLQRRWAEWSAHPAAPAALDAATSHFATLLRGEHFMAYSSSATGDSAGIRERFGIPADATLLVATMSSYDEVFAAEAIGALPDGALRGPFALQVDWIRALIGHLRTRPDRFLLIRVHPREFPNKRESVLSQHAGLLQREFADLPANVRINWPSDGVSVYDLAQEAEVFLNAWSNVGAEMALFGLPVVLYQRDVINYPSALNEVADSVDEYFVAIDRAVAAGWDFARIRQAFLWFAVKFVEGTLDLSASVGFSERRSLVQKVVGRLSDRLMPGRRERADCARRAPALAEAPLFVRLIVEGRESLLELRVPRPAGDQEALRAEDAAIRAGLRRIMAVMYPRDILATRLARRLAAAVAPPAQVAVEA